ncbi:MAG: hypothetical protein AB7I48_28340 [Planctomycetaceae bacterium]
MHATGRCRTAEVLLIAWGATSVASAGAAEPLPRAPQLFVDLNRVDNAHPTGRWKRMQNVRRTFHQAEVYPHPVLEPQTAWEQHGFTTSVIYDDEAGLFKMWYHTLAQTEPSRAVTCYAESDDGVHWRRPNLGLHEFQGSRDNNIVIPTDHHEGQDHFESVFKDPLESDPARRYKALGWSSFDWDGPLSGIYSAVSPDGLNWSFTSEPVFHYHPRPGTDDLGPVGDAQSLMIDTLKRRYVAFLRHFPHRAVSFSKDFVTWTQPETFLRTLHSRQEYYNNSAFVYGDQYLGIVSLFDLDPDRHDMNCWLISSRDCERWERCPAERPLIECGDIGEWNRFCTWNGGSPPIRVGDELYFYFRGAGRRHGPYFGDDNTDAKISVGLAKLRVDGFVSLDASFDGGELITTPWATEGGTLLLNAKCDYGEIRVELLGEDDEPLPGFALEDCVPVRADGVNLPVRWKDRSDLTGAAGMTARIHIQLKNARLYSYRRSDD